MGARAAYIYVRGEFYNETANLQLAIKYVRDSQKISERPCLILLSAYAGRPTARAS